MTISTTLPPSARDFQIYQHLLLDGASTRQTAADFSLSQTRVRQIAQHVAHWLATSLPISCEATDAAYLRLAQHIAADRLQVIYGEAMHGWRATHESKYASVILRVTAAMGKMPVTSGALDALLADALEGPLPDNPYEESISREQTCSRSTETPSTTETQRANKPTFDLDPATLNSSPPVGDCSPTPISPVPDAQSATPSPAVTLSPPTPSNAVLRPTSAARYDFLAPVHYREGEAFAEPSSAVTELKITPQSLGFTTKNHSSRRDRRRFRRLAAKS